MLLLDDKKGKVRAQRKRPSLAWISRGSGEGLLAVGLYCYLKKDIAKKINMISSVFP
jgi:hypothetical protein